MTKGSTDLKGFAGKFSSAIQVSQLSRNFPWVCHKTRRAAIIEYNLEHSAIKSTFTVTVVVARLSWRCSVGNWHNSTEELYKSLSLTRLADTEACRRREILNLRESWAASTSYGRSQKQLPIAKNAPPNCSRIGGLERPVTIHLYLRLFVGQTKRKEKYLNQKGFDLYIWYIADPAAVLDSLAGCRCLRRRFKTNVFKNLEGTRMKGINLGRIICKSLIKAMLSLTVIWLKKKILRGSGNLN